MTPEAILKALLEDIYIQLTIMEGEANHCLVTNHFKDFKQHLVLLKAIAGALGVDTSKYDDKF